MSMSTSRRPHSSDPFCLPPNRPSSGSWSSSSSSSSSSRVRSNLLGCAAADDDHIAAHAQVYELACVQCAINSRRYDDYRRWRGRMIMLAVADWWHHCACRLVAISWRTDAEILFGRWKRNGETGEMKERTDEWMKAVGHSVCWVESLYFCPLNEVMFTERSFRNQPQQQVKEEVHGGTEKEEEEMSLLMMVDNVMQEDYIWVHHQWSPCRDTVEIVGDGVWRDGGGVAGRALFRFSWQFK